jgi:nucleoside-diphosphate-sugar epimerase
MKCLITGSKGFTGKHLKESLLKDGFDVIDCDVDILDKNTLKAFLKEKQPDCVAHLAAQSFVHNSDVSSIYNTNIVGTYNLLDAVFETCKNVKSILLASSATVYGNKEGTLNESTDVHPQNDYGVSKLAMEHMASLWFNKLPIFIVRPFNYTGVGQANHFLIPKIVDHFKKKEHFIELGNIDVSREFQDVRDVVYFYKSLLQHPPLHKTINICSGVSYALKDVLSLLEGVTGHKIEIKINQDFVRPNDMKELKGDPHQLYSLIEKKKIYNLRDTLEWMLDENRN